MGLAVLVIGTTPCLAGSAPERILVKYRAGTAPSERESVAQRLGARRIAAIDLIGVDVLEVQEGAGKAIAAAGQSPNVEYAEADHPVHVSVQPDDPLFSQLWGLHNTGQLDGLPGADIRAPEAWDLYTGDPNTLVGVIDTGIDPNHPDLARNLWTNPGEIPGNRVDDDGNGYVDDVHGYDFFHGDGVPFDDYGHGAHVAGTIGAAADDGVGVAGVCWNCRLVGIKFLGPNGSGSVSGAIMALEYAVRVGCRVTNHSYGGVEYSRAWEEAIDAAGRAGVLCVVAAGNASQNIDFEAFYPATFESPYIVVVAATNPRDDLAPFSNYGTTTVDLAAPGDGILSVRSGGGWIYLSGTSMATPHVTGAAALVLGRFPHLDPLQVKDRIMRGVEALPTLTGLCVTGGRLDLVGCLTRIDSIPPGGIDDLSVTDIGSTTATMTWSAPGDDGQSGRAWGYDARVAPDPIDAGNFETASVLPGPRPELPGALQRLDVDDLQYATSYWVAVRAVDEDGNRGPISNIASFTTLGTPRIEWTPTNIDVSLRTGQSTTRALTVRNVGDGRLDFQIPPVRIELPPKSPKFVPPVLRLAKGGTDPRTGEPVLAGSGGPDGYGYRWIDSDEPGGPSVHWDDRGNLVTNLNGDEQLSGPISIPFAFPFYGSLFNQVRVSTNGFISFTDVANPWTNQPLPSQAAPLNLVAPFWDDLDLQGARRIRVYASGTEFVVSWSGVHRYREPEEFSFQVRLEPGGDIQFDYDALGVPRNNCTVGIQGGDASQGLTVAFNADLLHSNYSIRIVRLPQWAEVSPSNGRLMAGESVDLELRLEAHDLAPGDYHGTVEILSNAVQAADVSIGLQVEGAPDIVANPPGLDFGTVFVGATSERLLQLSNAGSADLQVTDITSTAPLDFDPTTLQLAPHETRVVHVFFRPSATGPLAGSVSVHSNDLETPVLGIPLAGEAIPAPSFSLSAESLLVQLPTNGVLTRSLRLTNVGRSPYVFSAQPIVVPAAIADPGTRVILRPASHDGGDPGTTSPVAGTSGTQAGGPDRFGYRWEDSDDPNGPEYQWIEIGGVGTAIPFAGDDENLGPFPIGFDFPFYGSPVHTFRVSTNGFVTFTWQEPAYLNGPLPSRAPAAPANLLAVLWDDLDLTSHGRVWYHDDGSRLVVEFQDVVRKGADEADAPNTFEALLYPDGRIVYQYQAVNARVRDSNTIGIQNGARDDGLEVAFDAPYARAGLALRFTPPADFLTVTPTGGTVAPGSFIDLGVGFHAAGLRSGLFHAALRLSGNDPQLPEFDVPVQLLVVGAPDLAIEPAQIEFGPVNLGFPQVRQLTVRNLGSDPLVVSRITATDSVFSVGTEGFVVPAFGRALVDVGFAPREAVHIDAQLEIKSNDPDRPTDFVAVGGTGREAPDLDITGASLLVARLPPGGDAVRALSIHNLGGSDLTYEITVGAAAFPELTAGRRDGDEGSDLGKWDADPRPGIEGSGGPDGFGYRWRDSDEPGGPEFEWIPLEGTGTAIDLKRDDQTRAGIPLGFDFQFYGRTFSSINVCTNGWLSFSSEDSSYSNQPLPNPGQRVPRDLVAPLWDDFRPTYGTEIRYSSDAERFVVSWMDISHFLTGESYTFQAILRRNGRMVFQYLHVPRSGTSATIGIQDSQGGSGLLIAYNTNQARDGLALEILNDREWLAAGPVTGTVQPGGRQDVEIRLSAGTLQHGRFVGQLRITSNDPDAGVVEVPVTLLVSELTDLEATLPRRDALRLFSGNPSRAFAEFELALSHAGPVEVDVYDVRGARIRRLGAGDLASGWHHLTWDGTDARGRRVASGVYFASARTRQGTTVARFTLLR